MRRQIFTLTLFVTILLNAQAQKEVGTALFTHLKSDALILSEGGLIRSSQSIKYFISDFEKRNGKRSQYEKKFSIEVNSILDYESGEIQGETDSFSVMFLKRKDDDSGPKIEFLVIYKKLDAVNQISEIDQSRNEWMELCNAHQASKLVSQLYQSEAYYYNRGRLLQGAASITAEYSYMNSAGYSLKLTPKHVEFVTPVIAFEIGRCSGSYPNPYMLLWEKQANGKWQVLMDSNY